ncbi:Low affinity Fe/Cu permease [Roseomonas rosea]|uniref:Low affinity Fe/Cu permease n=1 Tax=Muricoccus roseus TaxID=198092 RepID=A0A1M6H250_9PROT|nr:low affinity iron permease family protein [Roseomonas rosea]SHJ16303.1 Low affinity Fe/Cu permease [Roseomonas rosea]
MSFSKLFNDVASRVAQATGRPLTFVLCVAIVVSWALSGPLFGFSDTWQLVINTGTTIVTFLMVFLIQNTQNRDGAAIQAKLDELIRTSAAGNAFIGIEHLTEEELDKIRATCEQRARMAEAADTAEDQANRRAAAAAEAATS